MLPIDEAIKVEFPLAKINYGGYRDLIKSGLGFSDLPEEDKKAVLFFAVFEIKKLSQAKDAESIGYILRCFDDRVKSAIIESLKSGRN